MPEAPNSKISKHFLDQKIGLFKKNIFFYEPKMIKVLFFIFFGEIFGQVAMKQLNWKLTQLTNKSEKKFKDYEEALLLIGKFRVKTI